MQRRTTNIVASLGLILSLVTSVNAQLDLNKESYSQEEVKVLLENEKEYEKWYGNLTVPGVKIEGESMIFSEEAKALIADPKYRKSIYKEAYTFIDVTQSLSESDFKLAFWQMINLYPDHKDDVVRFIFAYDSVFPTDEVTTAAFYTYAFFDPKITKLENGKPNIYRPDIFEELFRNTQEIVSYVAYFRKQNKKTGQ